MVGPAKSEAPPRVRMPLTVTSAVPESVVAGISSVPALTLTLPVTTTRSPLMLEVPALFLLIVPAAVH